MTWLEMTILNNTLRDWLLAVGVMVGLALVLRLLSAFVFGRLAKLADRTANNLDDAVISALKRTSFITFLGVGYLAGRHLVALGDQVHAGITKVLVVIFLIQVGLWVVHAAREWLAHYRTRQLESDRATATAVGTISFVVQMATWSIVLLMILSNMGVNITALVTGLGIGGIAVALALQNVFSDLFASLSIVFDKPFVIGDFLIVGDHLGSVENVGLKTTRLRSLSGEQLVFANSDLLGSRVRNFGRMMERRVLFKLGVIYDTDQEKLKAIPTIVREVIEQEAERVRFDRCHFAAYGDFSLTIETVYYVLEPDYNVYMDIQQNINLAIRERFIAEGIEFAYPTQTLLLRRDPA